MSPCGTVTIGTTPTQITVYDHLTTCVVVQNVGDQDVILGAHTVEATGPAAGLVLAAGATLTIPAAIGIHGIVPTGTGAVAFLVGTSRTE